MNRGSALLTVAWKFSNTGFNEAPIHESGKSSWPCARRSTGSPSFNEAPIHESGKYRLAGVGAHARPASMRPRFMNRGSIV